jgi:hypothetical protein
MYGVYVFKSRRALDDPGGSHPVIVGNGKRKIAGRHSEPARFQIDSRSPFGDGITV